MSDIKKLTPAALAAFYEWLKDQDGIMDQGDLENYRDEALDSYGPVQIGNLTFSASAIVAEMDPTAYNCALSDIDANEIDIDGSEYYHLDTTEDEFLDKFIDSECGECEICGMIGLLEEIDYDCSDAENPEETANDFHGGGVDVCKECQANWKEGAK